MQESPGCQTPTGPLCWAQQATPCHLVPLPMGVELLVGEQLAPGSLGNGAKSALQGPLWAPVVGRALPWLPLPRDAPRGMKSMVLAVGSLAPACQHPWVPGIASCPAQLSPPWSVLCACLHGQVVAQFGLNCLTDSLPMFAWTRSRSSWVHSARSDCRQRLPAGPGRSCQTGDGAEDGSLTPQRDLKTKWNSEMNVQSWWSVTGACGLWCLLTLKHGAWVWEGIYTRIRAHPGANPWVWFLAPALLCCNFL